MPRSALAASLVALIVLAACNASPVEPSPTSPGPSPAVSAPPSLTPSPSPMVTPPPVEPAPSEQPAAQPSDQPLSAEEQYLLDGILRGAIECQPVRDDLPPRALAGVDCASGEPAVARIGFYLFDSDATMLETYVDRMTAEGIALDSGGCIAGEGEGEGAYVPGEEMVPYRHGCFVNDQGFANYRATLPGGHVYIGILGRTADMSVLQDFAWVGSRDTPGNPTLWGEPGR